MSENKLVEDIREAYDSYEKERRTQIERTGKGSPVAKHSEKRIDAFRKIAETEARKEGGEYMELVYATSSALEVKNTEYYAIHISTARAMEKAGLVTLKRVSGGGLWNEPDRTYVEFTDAGRKEWEAYCKENGQDQEEPEPAVIYEKNGRGYGFAHKNCPDCIRLAYQARTIAEEHGASFSEYPVGSHLGVWKA